MNGDILLPASPVPPGKWPLKLKERGCSVKNRTKAEPKRCGSYSVLSLTEMLHCSFTRFTVNHTLIHLGNQVQIPHIMTFVLSQLAGIYNRMTPWKNHISSTTMKLVKPVMQQNISSCSVLPPQIVMHDAFNVILWTFTDICVVVHDDLRWKNWFWTQVLESWLQSIRIHRHSLSILTK